MKWSIPSGAQVKALLRKLEYGELPGIAKAAGMPVSTIYAIRDHGGEPNPGVDTVRKFLPHLVKAVGREG